MKIGYARVSTKDQNLDLQLDALKNEGCEKIFREKISASRDRPSLEEVLSFLREGDTLIIWKLDRLGRSLNHLVTIIDFLNKKKIEFKSIQDSIDTSSAIGRLQFGILASLAEYEREIIIERTKAGLLSAKSRGKTGGRPKGLSDKSKVKLKQVKRLYEEGVTTEKICELLNIGSKATLYRYLKMSNTPLRRNKTQ